MLNYHKKFQQKKLEYQDKQYQIGNLERLLLILNLLKLLSKALNVSVDEFLDNDIKEVLAIKVSNTGKLAGMIIKILKAIGIIFALLLFIDVITLIIFNVTKMDYKVYNEKTDVYLVCSLNNEEYEYLVSYDNDDNILGYSGSKFIDNILENKEFEFGTSMVKYIESYFKNSGGICK